jgi:hypothetical protein
MSDDKGIKHQSNFYKFTVGRFKMGGGAVKSGENFTTNIRPARCEICTELLVSHMIRGGGNYTLRAGMPKMCDLCFEKFADRAMEMMNGG